jgi:hypothetical protein
MTEPAKPRDPQGKVAFIVRFFELKPMQLLHVPMKQGYIWVRQGLWLFCRNPAVSLMLVLLYIFLIQFALLIPIIGVLAVLISTPTIFLGFMAVYRAMLGGPGFKFSLLFQGYWQKNPKIAKRLLGLGFIYAAAVLLISLVIVNLIDLRALLPAIARGQTTAPAIRQLYVALFLGGLLYLPVAMLLWFAPLFVAWENTSITQALFFSWLGCWRNRYAFALYLAIWVVVFGVVPLWLENLLGQLSAEKLARFVITPYTITMMAWLYSSFYATWKGCFAEEKDASV